MPPPSPSAAPARRTKQVLFKATEGEKDQFKRASEKSTSPDLSSWIRTTLTRAAEELGVLSKQE